VNATITVAVILLVSGLLLWLLVSVWGNMHTSKRHDYHADNNNEDNRYDDPAHCIDPPESEW
jgi:hypothetical protein